MADKTELCHSVHSTFEALVVLPCIWASLWRRISSFCLLMLTAGIALLSASQPFAEHNSQI